MSTLKIKSKRVRMFVCERERERKKDGVSGFVFPAFVLSTVCIIFGPGRPVK